MNRFHSALLHHTSPRVLILPLAIVITYHHPYPFPGVGIDCSSPRLVNLYPIPTYEERLLPLFQRWPSSSRPMATPKPRSGRSTSLRESVDNIRLTESEKIEGTGSWETLEWTNIEIWDLRVQQNSSLFNGKKFRVDRPYSVGLTPIICPAIFVGTNLNPMWEKFLVPSEDDCRKCQHTTSPLGSGAVVETSDKKILVLHRSYNVFFLEAIPRYLF
ncbi:hypothetical protein RHGRI_023680 [Rhododendron griersonianum]|uniref:Uncharacterized protein n=1 Tax=Rhododendron griersonianum TaxID=479676 RepID=A0AAV6J9S0_9ERIC|nr:hypothetical protein RHGRI_023680 [Rhododendron griersonianum]